MNLENIFTHAVAQVQDEKNKILLFYDENSCFSNDSAFPVYYNGCDWRTAAHAYHASKFLLSRSESRNVFWEIHDARSVPEVESIVKRSIRWAHSRKGYLRVSEMRNILRCKLEQHDYVRERLLATGVRRLVNTYPGAEYWGTRPYGEGRNMLGQLWEEIRAGLQTGW